MAMERLDDAERDTAREERRRARERCVARLSRVNALLVRLRRALGWNHGDEARWASWGITAPEAQALRAKLRAIANVLHVERATARGRLHGGTRLFATLDAQRAWLAKRTEYAEDFLGEVGLSALP
jgi:hypothetical protein